jgi:hypothetical protein
VSRTTHYATCVAVAVFFFAATLYITSEDSTAESIDGLASTQQAIQPFWEE